MAFRWPWLNGRVGLVLLYDVAVSVLAVPAAFYLRFESEGIAAREQLLFAILPAFAIYAAGVFLAFQIYRSKWQFVSLGDLYDIAIVATVLSVSLLVLDYVLVAPNLYGGFFFGKTTIVIYWMLDVFLLGAARLVFRSYKQSRQRPARKAAAALVLGRAADADVLLRAVENGAVESMRIVGILSPLADDLGRSIRGVEVLAPLHDLERAVAILERRGVRIVRVVLTPSALAPEARPEAILAMARRLGIVARRLPSLDDGRPVRTAPLAVEDLLLRPGVAIDYGRVEHVVRGKSVVVTGGGGSIGTELCRRIVDFGAARLMIVENSEPALHAIAEELAGSADGCKIEAHLADVRDRDRIMALFAAFQPDLVFHAAALKHVPILESDWAEGIKTNVFGSINVADAAVAAKARALVLVSTDKAVEPVSVLGATKRLAEMYCQALDAELGAHANATRLIAVRFGNVLASNGSVIPKFMAQIEAGGPITVTHPDMVRYFMTIREACDLVVTSAGHALGEARSPVALYVLNMGQPVKITELAERMIRLSGLEPGVDIDIVFTGVRPGERLNETLFAASEPTVDIGIPGIVGATPAFPELGAVRDRIAALESGLARGERNVLFGG
jgi:O-antigen biosynthesis protein WbqV